MFISAAAARSLTQQKGIIGLYIMPLSFEHLFPKLYDASAAAAAPWSGGDVDTSTFKLPIEYLEKKHIIPQSVISDLELNCGDYAAPVIEDFKNMSDISGVSGENAATPSMYFYLLNPRDEFAEKIMPKWTKYITSDVEFITDTQNILCAPSPKECTTPDNNAAVAQIWKEVKASNAAAFLEKYNYMDWKPLEFLNYSETFLNLMGLYNIISPLLSLLLPIILLIIPFFILRIRGISITFELYIEILKDIAKHNMIGKTLTAFSGGGLSAMSIDKLLYLSVSIFLYVMQTYQNTVCCIRFYNNTKKIRDYLKTMREFAERQIAQMTHFVGANCAGNCETYRPFCEETKKHIEVLRRFHGELSDLEGSSSVWMIGKMMRCFYLLHKDEEYDRALAYAIGFEGYILNLEGIRENLKSGVIHFGNVVASEHPPQPKKRRAKKRAFIKNQYYPALIGQGGGSGGGCAAAEPVKNTVSLNKSMIITGPNASGKTTAIKTTLLNIIFTQQIGAGFYDGCSLVPYTHIHSYLNIPDTSNRDSLFQAEARRCKEIITAVSDNDADAGARHFAIFDELFSGTNAKESIKTGQSFLKYLGRREHVDFVMTTHFTEICRNLKKNTAIRMLQMETNPKENGEFEYTYKMQPGISNVLGAVKVLKDMEFPHEILIDL